MAQLTFLVILLGIYMSLNSIVIKATSVPKLIVGGKTAYSGQFPYQVSIRDSWNTHFCGGSIISNRFCLTAAHCLYGRKPDNTFAVVGTIERKSGIVHASTALIVHKGYNEAENTNDISLLKTAKPIVFSNLVQPIRIATSYIGGGMKAVASAWGGIYKRDESSNYLQYLNVTTLTNEECKKYLGVKEGAFVYDSIICIEDPTGQGMCNGDSGGPLVIDGKLVGLASWVMPCGVGYPVAFVRAFSHMQWIINNNAI